MISQKEKACYLPDRIRFKIFDKTALGTNGIYGLHPSKDENFLKRVHDNYRAVKSDLSADHLLILKQVHGNKVVDADLISSFLEEPEGDAAVTSQPNIILSIQTADCVPVLFASAKGDVIGVAHCGWRSARSDIIRAVVKLMRDKGAREITAIIGPAIHQESYEVDRIFYDEIINELPEASSLFKAVSQSKKDKKWLFDLPGFVRLKLHHSDIYNIIDKCENTYTQPDNYYSYRRNCHANISDHKNRLLSTILILS